MKIHFLGSGAADHIISEKRTDKDFRRFSSALIDKSLLIDAGPCIFEFCESFEHKELLNDIEFVVQTHSHSDHFCPENINAVCKTKKIKVFGDISLEKHLLKSKNLDFISVKPFNEYKAGEYTLIPLLANHGVEENEGETALHYIIKKGDKCVFYGLDGAWLLKSTRLFLNKFKFDLMVFDATVGDIKGDYRIFEHNNLKMVELMCESIKAQGLLKNEGRFIISHMARTLHTNHQSLCERMKDSGIDVAFDDASFIF